MDQAYSKVLSSLRQRLEALTDERHKLENAIEAIEALIEPLPTKAQGDLLRATSPNPKTGSGQPQTYGEASQIVLGDSGVPMHVHAIIRAAQERGWFTGRDPKSRNLYNAWYAALNRRGDLFEKVGPSIYELRRPDNGSAPTPAEAEVGAG